MMPSRCLPPAVLAGLHGSAEVTCDYLVVGAGVQGLAFTDTLLATNKNVTVLIVDKRDRPGGEWLSANSCTKLRIQMYFGIESFPFTSYPSEDDVVSKDDVVSYFVAAMKFLEKTGRVRFMPLCKASPDGRRLVSVLDPASAWTVAVRRKVVDSRPTAIPLPPSMHRFKVSGGAKVVLADDLLRFLAPAPPCYVVIGAGNTAVDIVLWLLSGGLPPDRLHWVVPRDCWYMCREALMPKNMPTSVKNFVKAAFTSLSLPRMCKTLEERSYWCRIDEDVQPEAFRCIGIKAEELNQLRQVNNIIRKGYVREVTGEGLILDDGFVSMPQDAVYVDAARSMRNPAEVVPVFAHNHITLQLAAFASGACFQVSMSGASIGLVEALYPFDTEAKNKMCLPHTMPRDPLELMRFHLAEGRDLAWGDKQVMSWMSSTRLGHMHSMSLTEIQECYHTDDAKLMAVGLRKLVRQGEAALCQAAAKDAVRGIALAAPRAPKADSSSASSCSTADCSTDPDSAPSTPSPTHRFPAAAELNSKTTESSAS